METKIKIEGMGCVSCEPLITNALKQVDGVVDVTVSFVSSQAIVISEGEKATPDAYLKAIKSTGYNAYLLTEDKSEIAEEKYFRRQALSYPDVFRYQRVRVFTPLDAVGFIIHRPICLWVAVLCRQLFGSQAAFCQHGPFDRSGHLGGLFL